MSDALPTPILAVDASSYGGTVAVLRDGRIVASQTVAMRGEREERLMPAVVATLADAGLAPNALGGVVCGAGPGSFTSLRIAASIAKGIAHAASVPLFAVPSLALMAAGGPLPDGRYLTVLDAIRGEWYAADVTTAGGQVAGYEYLGVVAASHGPVLARERGARLVVPEGLVVASDESAVRASPDARGVAHAIALIASAGAVDLDGWEPEYGRKAEAQVKWEAAHGRALPADAGTPG
ncbi:MAG: tRNA (adenosine(37)-N6)-threonylcarbamoyltransferase complex dimerization subunit type 1 TsaB [Gemmatirosa sp.]|nr:tRNA (adenosine(37)-N6)-threonylcarbamoyltransferase complex dimerization subunit type 1 TsaB [Gemmatirosa sp.]